MRGNVAASAIAIALTLTACSSLSDQSARQNGDAAGANQRSASVETDPGYNTYAADKDTTASCWDATKMAGERHGLPPGLLPAIALVESGMDPTVLRIGGHSLHPATNEEAKRLALAALRQSKGVMAGCLQVNLRVHDPEGALWALKPTEAADWAAARLVDLHDQLGSWSAAIRRYGGGSSRAYVRRITERWHTIGTQDPFDQVAEAP